MFQFLVSKGTLCMTT